MRTRLPLIAAAVAAFLVSLIVWLPARLIAPFLPASVAVGALQGTVWNGSTDALLVNSAALGALRWRLHVLPLLRGRAVLDVELQSATSRAQGQVGVGFGGTIEAHDLHLQAPLAALPAQIVPPRWQGNISAHLQDFSFDGKQVTRVLGTLDLHHLQAPPPNGVAIGSYRLVFDEKSRQDDRWTGRLQDLEGPMQVAGTLSFGHERDYLLEGTVAPRAGATEAINTTLRYLGEPDAQGRRPFSIAGTY